MFDVYRIRIDVAVIAFGMDQPFFRRLTEARVYVFVMVGMEVRRARRSPGARTASSPKDPKRADISPARHRRGFLPRALEIADGRPVLLAGGIATADDTRAALAAGANGVVAGTRFC